jgi:acetylornithine deacetylase/succinyl-diaminopimelate desuccinylase-like protein
VSLRLDRRIIPEEDPAVVEQRLRQVIADAIANCLGITLDIRRLLLARPLFAQPGHERLVAAIAARASAVFGEPVAATGTPLYTDARLYGEAGIPIVLYGAGPRTIIEANAKRADENLLLEDLRRATITVAGALFDLLAAS